MLLSLRSASQCRGQLISCCRLCSSSSCHVNIAVPPINALRCHARRTAFMRAPFLGRCCTLCPHPHRLITLRGGCQEVYKAVARSLRGGRQESPVTCPVAINGRNWGSDHGVSARAPTGTVAISFPVRGWGSPSRHQENHISQLPFLT